MGVPGQFLVPFLKSKGNAKQIWFVSELRELLAACGVLLAGGATCCMGARSCLSPRRGAFCSEVSQDIPAVLLSLGCVQQQARARGLILYFLQL